MSKNRFIVSGNLSSTDARKFHEAITEIKAGSVVVSVTFKQSLGNLRAYQGRDGKIIKSGTITAVGQGAIVLDRPQPGDTIGIDGESEGTATVTINVPTTDPTPVNYKAGPFGSIFIVN